MSTQQQLGILCQLVLFVITTVEAANWRVEIADPEPVSNDDVPILSAENSEKGDLTKSGTAWIRTYNKPPGTDVATIYNSDISRSDAWDPIKDVHKVSSFTKSPNLFTITKKPAASIRFGVKTTNVATPSTVVNGKQADNQKIGSAGTLGETKEKNRKTVKWTSYNKSKDWSLKNTANINENANDDYEMSSMPTDTVSETPMAERRDTAEETSAAEFNDHSASSVEATEGDPQDWKVVDEDGTNGWKVLDKAGNVEWEIKLENGSWIVLDQDGAFSHKVDIPITLNTNDSAYTYENDYLTDYGSPYEEMDYDVPDNAEIYVLSDYDDAWPKVTNIAIPEPWRQEEPQSHQDLVEFWPRGTNSTNTAMGSDEVTTATQTSLITEKQYPIQIERIIFETTEQPQLEAKTSVDTDERSGVSIRSKYYDKFNKYSNGNKAMPKYGVKKQSANEVTWAPNVAEITTPITFDQNENTSSKYDNNSPEIELSERTVQSKNSARPQSQWITGYGSQTWKAGGGQKDWDSDNSTDDSGNKISAWGSGYGSKIWKGNEWNSNVVWKTGYGQGLWNVDNGTGTFTFPNAYDNDGKTTGKSYYKGKNIPFRHKAQPPQSQKAEIDTSKQIFLLQDTTSENVDNQKNGKQEEWGDDKSVGGVVWQNENEFPINGNKWIFPDDNASNSGNINASRSKKYIPKTWNAQWSKTPFIVTGPGWKPSTTFSEENGWKPSVMDNENWKMADDSKQQTNAPTDGTLTEKPPKSIEPILENKKSLNSQFRKFAPGNSKDNEWALYRDNNPPRKVWKTSGKSWRPPIFVWPQENYETSTSTIPSIDDPSDLTPTVTYSLEPNPIYIKWRKPSPSSFKWPVVTPASMKWTKPSKKWRKPTPTKKMTTTKHTTTTTKRTTTTTTIKPTTSKTTQRPWTPTPEPSPKFLPIKYIWPVKTFKAKSWKPLQVMNPPDCKDKETTMSPTMPTTVMMETTTETPVTEKTTNDDKTNLEHPPIIIIKKVPHGYKKLSGKGRGRPKFRPRPSNTYEWGNYKGKPLKISGSKGMGYYKGTPFKVISPNKSKRQKMRGKIPKWMKSNYKGSPISAIPELNGWSSMKPNYAKWISSSPITHQKPSSSTRAKPTWKETFKKIFG